MTEPVILDGIRTPFGRRAGILRDWRPDSLLGFVLKAILNRSGMPPNKIDDVIAGCVSQAGEQGANIARLAGMLAGLPVDVPGVSLNRMCGSSQQAIHFAAQSVAAGDNAYVIACGVESMSRVPMFLDVTLGKHGFRDFADLNPDLLKAHALVHQGESAELIAEKWNIARTELDEYAKESHRRALAASSNGSQRETVAIEGIDAEGIPTTLTRDEGIRSVIDDTKIAAMTPVFRSEGEGVITAAHASQIADGAAAILIADRETATADGLKPRAKFLSRVAIGSDPILQLTGVIPATQKALKRAGLSLTDIDWIEINEAFASVVLAWMREQPANLNRVNPWGGAIAHGHPLGATGAGLMAKMLTGLESTDGEFGLQVMCIGHGMATATVIQRL